MKNLLITCDNEQEFFAVLGKYSKGDRPGFEWESDNNVIDISDGEAKGYCTARWYDHDSDYNNHKRITAKNLNLTKKTMSKKTYKTTVSVEKTIKYSLPKYEVGKPIHVDIAERDGLTDPYRVTILPYRAYWNYDKNENVYEYRAKNSFYELAESYINKHLIKA